MFIAIYGINNIGKTTHAKRLVKNLKKMGKNAVYIKYPAYDVEPTGTFLNKIIRSGKQYITEEELQLWFTLNRHQYQKTLFEYLKKGYIVVAEDYTATGIAWGTAKGADRGWLEEINRYLIKENFAIMLKGERALHAVEKEHIHENEPEVIDEVRKTLIRMSEEKKWKVVELQAKKSDTEKLILDIVKKELGC